MKTTDFIKEYFDVSFKIHELCDKKGYSVDTARLFTYIHIKISENGPDYFNRKNETEIDALQYLLNNKKLDIDKQLQQYAIPILNIPKRLKLLDSNLRDRYGMEFRIQSELLNRLRLHTDSKYRSKMVKLFSTEIAPLLDKASKAA